VTASAVGLTHLKWLFTALTGNHDVQNRSIKLLAVGLTESSLTVFFGVELNESEPFGLTGIVVLWDIGILDLTNFLEKSS